MTSDIDAQALIAYETGIAPLDYAEGEIAKLIDAHIIAAIRSDQNTFDVLGENVSPLAAQIVAAFLNAGWQMPVWPVPEPEAREAS